MCFNKLIMTLCFCGLFFGCSDKHSKVQSQPEKNSTPVIQESEPKYEIEMPAITAQYTIQKEDSYPTKKCSIIILLQEKTTEDQLRLIAEEVRSKSGRKKYNPLFIEYYLPGMVSGSGAYATSHYNPELEVKIMEFMLEGNPSETDPIKAEELFKEIKALGNNYTFHG